MEGRHLVGSSVGRRGGLALPPNASSHPGENVLLAQPQPYARSTLRHTRTRSSRRSCSVTRSRRPWARKRRWKACVPSASDFDAEASLTPDVPCVANAMPRGRSPRTGSAPRSEIRPRIFGPCRAGSGSPSAAPLPMLDCLQRRIRDAHAAHRRSGTRRDRQRGRRPTDDRDPASSPRRRRLGRVHRALGFDHQAAFSEHIREYLGERTNIDVGPAQRSVSVTTAASTSTSRSRSRVRVSGSVALQAARRNALARSRRSASVNVSRSIATVGIRCSVVDLPATRRCAVASRPVVHGRGAETDRIWPASLVDATEVRCCAR